MKVSKLINNGSLTINELFNYVDGGNLSKEVQKTLNEATGFEVAKLDINTDEATSEEIVNAEIIEATPDY